MNIAECKIKLIANLPTVLLDMVKDVNGTNWIRIKKYKVNGVWHRDFLLKDTIIGATMTEGSDIKFWIMPEWKVWNYYGRFILNGIGTDEIRKKLLQLE